MSKKFFLDLGYHQGQGLAKFSGELEIDNSWEIHCWEPNPENWKHFKRKGVTNHREAVWYRDCKLKLWQEYNNGSKDGWGSSVIRNWGFKTGKGYLEAQGGAPVCGSKPIMVKAIDFVAWILLNTDAEDELYIKMDIEGAEYAVLRSMISQDKVRKQCNRSSDEHFKKTGVPLPMASSLFGNIKWMAVEFHDRFMPRETPESTRELFDQVAQLTEIQKHW